MIFRAAWLLYVRSRWLRLISSTRVLSRGNAPTVCFDYIYSVSPSKCQYYISWPDVYVTRPPSNHSGACPFHFYPASGAALATVVVGSSIWVRLYLLTLCEALSARYYYLLSPMAAVFKECASCLEKKTRKLSTTENRTGDQPAYRATR